MEEQCEYCGSWDTFLDEEPDGTHTFLVCRSCTTEYAID